MNRKGGFNRPLDFIAWTSAECNLLCFVFFLLVCFPGLLNCLPLVLGGCGCTVVSVLLLLDHWANSTKFKTFAQLRSTPLVYIAVGGCILFLVMMLQFLVLLCHCQHMWNFIIQINHSYSSFNFHVKLLWCIVVVFDLNAWHFDPICHIDAGWCRIFPHGPIVCVDDQNNQFYFMLNIKLPTLAFGDHLTVVIMHCIIMALAFKL